MSGARPILVFYHIPGDGDEAETPNAFPVLKPDGQVMLQDVRSKFPLPGTWRRFFKGPSGWYHFRFKLRWGPDPLQVAWMDVTNEAAQVPLFDGKVVAKVTRISWDSKAGAPNGVVHAKAAAPKPPDVLSFDSPGLGPAPAPKAPAPSPYPAPKDDFDMLFS